MALIGNLGEFDSTKEEFANYVERMQQFFVANDINEERQVAVFLSVVGPKTYGLLKNLLAPETPQSKTLRVLCNTLQTHLHPVPLVIAERFKFYKRPQQSGESISSYVAELKKLSQHCDFGNFLPQALRNRLVCGIASEPTQRKLLSERDLTFDTAFQIAVTMEMADTNTRELQSQGTNENSSTDSRQVNKVSFVKGPPAWKGKDGQKGANSKLVCFRCGKGNHSPDDCHYIKCKCYTCSQIGHLAKMCKSGKQRKSGYTKFIADCEGHKWENFHEETPEEFPEIQELGIYSVGNKPQSDAYTAEFMVNGESITMEVDTGATMTILPVDVYKEKLSHVSLQRTKHQLPLLGEADVHVTYQGQTNTLPLVVADMTGQPPVLGRNWLKHIRLDWKEIFKVVEHTGIQDILDSHKAVFEPGCGTITGHTAKIHVQENATPRFFRPRPVPYALRDKVDRELEHLENEGIITKVETSNWASPIVVVEKSDKSVRICGDYKVTVNQCIDVSQHPLPTPQDLFSVLSGGRYFTKLDLTQAYQQMVLDEESKKFLTINTHRGLYVYNRLPYGVSSARSIFQNTMDKVLQGLEGGGCYQDDILIMSKTEAEHRARADAVLTRLEEHGIRLKPEKCEFMKPEVPFLGHVIDAEGLHPTAEKVKAIVDAPRPRDVSEVRSFLGMIQYYAKFLPRLSTTLHPLNDLLKAGTPWKWTKECDEAFKTAKEHLSSAPVLTHYDVSLPIKLDCDASSYGLGAVISHIMSDGSEKPVAFASRILTSSERNYAQLERESR